ncbi:MAG: formate dehydrogenase accessory sulfurtransferase FdhD [Lentisphaeraceae bacterium]|nr:formate dehydrogenase accessory sulfurtransferase FdhD [Lentisphaeraceae bacterium]
MKSNNYKGMLQEGDQTLERQESLVVEKALQIIVNGKEFSMTMQTPGDERYLVRGLLHAEGVNLSEFESFELTDSENGSVANTQVICKMEIHGKRRLGSTSSCGLCGKKSIDKLFNGFEPLSDDYSLNANEIQHFYKKVATQQTLFQKTGGCHAASAIDSSGNVLCVFEDIGRHNAVDKVVGWLLENDRLEDAKVLTVSGRVSFEIIQKCHRAGIPTLTAISAPSSLAVEMAEKANITLAAFCRGDRATFYSGFSRVNNIQELDLIG